MVTITNISKSFPGAFEPVLKKMTFHLQPADFCIVIGSNGSGKSTLMKIISGEYSPDVGQVTIQKDDVTHRDRCTMIASVIQDVNKGTIPEMTLLENITLSLSRSRKASFSFYHRQVKRIIQELQAVNIGLERYLHSPLSHLSGGQRQMVATIMAITSRPRVLLLDEHTSALDPAMQRVVMSYTAQAIAAQQLTSLMITHNLEDAVRYGNRLIMLHKGQIVFDICGKEKASLKVSELLTLFHKYEFEGLL